MKIVNGKGEETLTPKSLTKQAAKQELEELRKTPPKSILDVLRRIEKIEQYLEI